MEEKTVIGVLKHPKRQTGCVLAMSIGKIGV
jgi:hypothetical protein